jgi:hypothetical protein
MAAAAVGVKARSFCRRLHELEEGAAVSNVEGGRMMAFRDRSVEVRLAQELLDNLRAADRQGRHADDMMVSLVCAIDFLLSRYIDDGPR